MTRARHDDDHRSGRSSDAAFAIEDEISWGRSGRVIGDDGVLLRLGRRREDPSGRRSLTGLEFRRQRSTEAFVRY